MLIRGYVNYIEQILEGKEIGTLDEKRLNAALNLLNRLKTRDDVQNVMDMAMFYFDSLRLVGRINEDKQYDVYTDYLSALSEIARVHFQNRLAKKQYGENR